MTTLVADELAVRPLRRLLIWAFPANLGMSVQVVGLSGVLLPLQVAAVHDGTKAVNLALVTAFGAVAAMLTQPVAGAICDRTRSRFGARGPWIVGGAFAEGLALIGLGTAGTTLQIAAWWVCVQIAYSTAQGAFAAVLPDRVPAARRGVFSSIAGAGVMVGAIGGQILATRFAGDLPGGYLTIGGITVVALTSFVVFNPERDNRKRPRGALSARAVLACFWFDPRRNPDLGWAFLGRLFLLSGHFTVGSYQLYILQDHVGLGDEAVGFLPSLGIATAGGTILTTVLSGPLSDRLGRRRIFVFAGSVLLAAALLMPLVAPTKAGMVAYAMLTGVAFGFYVAVDTALISEVLPATGDFARDLGVMNIAGTLPQVIAPAVAGVIVTGVGYAGLFPVGIVFALLGGLAIVPIKSVR
ncbi:MFS transporter [Lentzea sp. NBRC 105346]|uniref:MFS transporter n=1 Tax=Lentzea sp. NBRC 105346 TaxID=3032205 RepID=UPI00249FD041|nr:MFS transporter [Lentzea sp. NBRC 105346]GLZ27973.1 MFS transporter [Lentzea sp. NBRC 105346]